jgi:hypothetical protein
MIKGVRALFLQCIFSLNGYSLCCWCAAGVLLVCCWCAAGVLLVCCWCAAGVLLVCCCESQAPAALPCRVMDVQVLLRPAAWVRLCRLFPKFRMTAGPAAYFDSYSRCV